MTVILANGDFPKHPAPLAILDGAERVVCCDGAAQALLDHGRMPDIVVGDLDSASPDLLARLEGHIARVARQDDNDLSKAFELCVDNGWKDIAILGATGKREDHTIGNFAHLFDFASQADSLEMVTDSGTFTALPPQKTARRFSSFPGQPVSIFTRSADTLVTARGLHWPINNAPLPFLWSGTLNKSDSDTFEVAFANGPGIVFRAFGKG